MADITYNAGEVIGKSLIAKKRIPVYTDYRPGIAKVIAYVEAGNTCGVVYSYVGGYSGIPLFWQFLTPNNSAYFIQHETGAFDQTNIVQQMQVAWINDLETKANNAVEAQTISEKGAIPYYIEKYGSILLLSVGGYLIFKEVMKYNGSKK